MAAATVAAIIGAVAATASSANAIEQGAQARRDAEGAAGRQKAAMDKAAADKALAEKKIADQTKQDEDRIKQKAIAPGALGRAGTILTSPDPVADTNLPLISGTKTMLGA